MTRFFFLSELCASVRDKPNRALRRFKDTIRSLRLAGYSSHLSHSNQLRKAELPLSQATGAFARDHYSVAAADRVGLIRRHGAGLEDEYVAFDDRQVEVLRVRRRIVNITAHLPRNLRPV